MSANADTHVRLTDHEGVVVAEFLDAHLTDDRDIEEVGEALYRLADTPDRPRIVLNFGRVETFASYFLGTIAKLKTKLDAVGGSLRLCCLLPDLQNAIHITGLDRVVLIDSDERTSLEKS